MQYWFVFAVSMPVLIAAATGGSCPKCSPSCVCCPNGQATCDGEGRVEFRIPHLPGNITRVIVQKAEIKNVSRITFENIKHLHLTSLTLITNWMRNISENAFVDLQFLQDLKLNNNMELNKDQLAVSLGSLQKEVDLRLVLTKVGITKLRSTFFTGLENASLVKLSLAKNDLKIYNESVFAKLLKLKTLDLSYNRIHMKTGRGHPTIERLILSNNRFLKYPPSFCGMDKGGGNYSLYPRLRHLILHGSWIRDIAPLTIECLNKLIHLDLSKKFIFQIKDNAFSKLESLNTLALDHMLTSIVDLQPYAFNVTTLKKLNFKGNKIPKSSKKATCSMFALCPNIEQLDISETRFVTNTKFLVDLLSPLKRIQKLKLTNIQLSSVPRGLFSRFENLTQLYLNDNDITRWDSRVFDNVSGLQDLQLSGNNIRVLNEVSFPPTFLTGLRTLNLANNKFQCDCQMLWFRNWIEDHKGNVSFPGYPIRYVCKYPAEMDGTLFENYHPTIESCANRNVLLIPLAICGTLVVLSIMIASLTYRGRWYIRYWFFKLRRQKMTGEASPLLSPSEANTFDAYVVYSLDDIRFIRDDLCQMVEHDLGFKLLIRDRDSGLGSAKVDHIADDIYNCRRVIAIVSSAFLNDPWCKFQVDVALDRQIELGRNTLFLLKLEEVENRCLTKAWCVLFTRTPSAEWSNNELRRKVIVQQLLQHLRVDT